MSTFVDYVKVELSSGKGGDGIVAFRREKYVPLGGPAGGDGGRGGDVIFEVDTNKNTLLDLKFNRKISAGGGENGKPKKMHGASGNDVIVKIPLGTIIRNADNGEVIADFTQLKQKEVILKGGAGGRGNFRFATSRNSAPDFAEKGELGITLEVIVELKILADCGLVGLPSVGKSTILSVVSKAKPDIADYPFTTLSPNLGLVAINDSSFVMADLPGLIEDAHLGKGLGIQFLKHIERCRIIIHVLDMSGGNEQRDPLEDFLIINNELEKYDPVLIKRPMIVVANKMDENVSEENLTRFKKKYPNLEIFPTISLLNEGLSAVLARVVEIMKENPIIEEAITDQRVIYKFAEADDDIKVVKEANHLYRLIGTPIDRMYRRADLDSELGIRRFAYQLKKLDVEHLLLEAGAISGDSILIYDYQFDFISEADMD
ncbi:MAG: GTPase ObgE [Erysipelotrichaceae bacterium]